MTQTFCVDTADEVRGLVTYGLPGAATNLLPVLMTTRAGDNSVSATTQMTYTDAGDPLTVDGPLAGTDDTTRYRYDGARQPIGVVGPDPDGAGPLLNRARRVTYNLDGSVSLVEAGATAGQSDPAWANFTSYQQTAIQYDGYIRPTVSRFTAGGPTYSASQVRYDAAGRVECSAERMNPAIFASLPVSACDLGTEGTFGPDRITRLTYDAASQVTATTSGWGTSDPLTETLTYNANGRPLTLVDGNGNRSAMVYDGFDRLSRLQYPTASNGSVTNLGDYQEYGYDANSNVTSYRTRNNQLFSTTFDALNRRTAVTQTTTPANVGNYTYSYDLFNRPLTASVTAVAASTTPFTPASPASTISMTYDALGRLRSQNDSVLGQTTMQYDPAGRRTRLEWPDGFFVTYGYDLTNAMTQVLGNGVTAYATYGYDNLGRRAQVTRSNGATTTYGYDPASRLTSLAHAFPSGSNNLTLTYAHNPAGQIVSRTPSNSTYDFPSPSFGTTTYGVNGLNQTGIDTTPPYDQAFTHDAKGNMLSDGTRVYTYDQVNRLRSSAAGGTVNATLAYDALGRLSQLVGTQGARYLHDGVEIAGIAPATGSTALINRIVRGPWPDEVVATVPPSGSPTWLLADEQGSTIALAVDTGAVAGTLAYDEYGNPRSGNAGRFQYTGQMWLPDAQTYYYKARAYHPGFGRFLQTDPIGYGAGMNLYAYVGDDPVNLTDPLGLTQEPFGPPTTVDDIFVTGPRQEPPGGGFVGFGSGRPGGSANCNAQFLSFVVYEAGVGSGCDGGGGSLVAPSLDIVVVGDRKRYHEFRIERYNRCSSGGAFNLITQPGMSAPGAPAARDGFTPYVPLLGGDSISQAVSFNDRTISNTTLPGHRFHPGNVYISVVDNPSGGSNLSIIGTGTGANYELNYVLFYGFFGGVADVVSTKCSLALFPI